VGTTLFTAADIADMKAFNDANLPDTIGLRSGTKTYGPGGSGSIVWAPGDPTWTEPCRVSPASTPQEALSAGAITEVKDFWVITREGVIVPQNSGTTFYRLEWQRDINADPLPPLFMLYLRGTPLRSYRMLSKFLCTTVAPV
jgi:hypothetical protein